MKSILECFKKIKNLPLAKTFVVKDESDLLKLKFPYYMKASLSEHKLEKKAVIRIENLEDSITEFKRLKNEFKRTPILIQEEIVGTEMIIGIKEDPVFEKLLLIGIGGKNAEIFKDVQFRALPVSKNEIKKALEDLKFYKLLHNLDINKFINLAYEVSRLRFKELDLNPVIVNEKRAVIVDSRGDW